MVTEWGLTEPPPISELDDVTGDAMDEARRQVRVYNLREGDTLADGRVVEFDPAVRVWFTDDTNQTFHDADEIVELRGMTHAFEIRGGSIMVDTAARTLELSDPLAMRSAEVRRDLHEIWKHHAELIKLPFPFDDWDETLSRGWSWRGREPRTQGGGTSFMMDETHLVFTVDTGMTEHHTTIAVTRETGEALAQIHLEQVTIECQYRLLETLFGYYHPLRVIMDRTGVGLMLFEYIREYGDRHLAQRLEPMESTPR